MNLNELIEIRGKPLEKHDYEFLVGDDGLSHLLVCVNVRQNVDHRGKPIGLAFEFFCPCGHFSGKETKIGRYEVATGITCMVCNAA